MGFLVMQVEMCMIITHFACINRKHGPLERSSCAQCSRALLGHCLTPSLALYTASNGQVYLTTMERAIKDAAAIMLQQNEQLVKPDMSEKILLERCYDIKKRRDMTTDESDGKGDGESGSLNDGKRDDKSDGESGNEKRWQA